jgi:hypothetical protein
VHQASTERASRRHRSAAIYVVDYHAVRSNCGECFKAPTWPWPTLPVSDSGVKGVIVRIEISVVCLSSRRESFVMQRDRTNVVDESVDEDKEFE